MADVPNISGADFAHLLGKARDAVAGGINAMSTGEALAAALILNRPDWLAAMNYTMAEAMERIGAEWVRLIPAAAKQFERESHDAAYQAAEQARQARLTEFGQRQQADETLEFSASLVTSGNAPGYRDVSLIFDLHPIGDRAAPPMRVGIRLKPEDGEGVVHEITDVHRFAWRNGKPIDIKPGEERPRWIDRQ